MSARKLSEDEIVLHLQQLSGWTVKNRKLHREYKFPDFAHAIDFMTTAAVLIEKINHHPEWCNVYGRVTVDLITHDSDGITRHDIDLAGILDSVAGKLLSTGSPANG